MIYIYIYIETGGLSKCVWCESSVDGFREIVILHRVWSRAQQTKYF